MTRRRRTAATPVVGVILGPVLGLVLVLAGCSEEQEGTDAVGGAQEGAAVAAPAAADVRVGLTEWTIALSRTSVHPGPITLLVTNAGATEHDVVVRGRAGEWHSEDLAPGQQQRLDVVARAGETLTLWCAEPGHEAQGMRTVLDVTGGAG